MNTIQNQIGTQLSSWQQFLLKNKEQRQYIDCWAYRDHMQKVYNKKITYPQTSKGFFDNLIESFRAITMPIEDHYDVLIIKCSNKEKVIIPLYLKQKLIDDSSYFQTLFAGLYFEVKQGEIKLKNYVKQDLEELIDIWLGYKIVADLSKAVEMISLGGYIDLFPNDCIDMIINYYFIEDVNNLHEYENIQKFGMNTDHLLATVKIAQHLLNKSIPSQLRCNIRCFFEIASINILKTKTNFEFLQTTLQTADDFGLDTIKIPNHFGNNSISNPR